VRKKRKERLLKKRKNQVNFRVKLHSTTSRSMMLMRQM
jgi:hypothetical protein